MVSRDERSWKQVSEGAFTPPGPAGLPDVRESLIDGPGGRLLVWSWYRIGNHYTSDKYLAKLWEAFQVLSFRRSDAAILGVATPVGPDVATDRARLEAFVAAALPSLGTVMARAAGLEVGASP
jgi:EpsI family protein